MRLAAIKYHSPRYTRIFFSIMQRMLSRLLLIPLSSLTCLFSNAQINNYAEVDSFMSAVPFQINETKDLDSLIHVIEKKFSKEEEKVRAIYFWVTDNIAYDMDGLYRGKMISTKEEALLKKRCVCSGYADILDYSFSKMGLESAVVTGIARTLNAKMEWDVNSWMNGHAWNAVRVEGSWRLIDATWASGYAYFDVFKKKRNDGYFFTSPHMFLLDHFPSIAKWQLMGDSAISKKQFYDQPFALFNFHKAGLLSISPSVAIVRGQPGNVIEFSFTSSKEINTVFIGPHGGKVTTIEVFPEDGVYKFQYELKEYSQGKFVVGFGYKDDKRRYKWMAEEALGYLFAFSLPENNN